MDFADFFDNVDILFIHHSPFQIIIQLGLDYILLIMELWRIHSGMYISNMAYTQQATAQDRRNALMERILMRKFNNLESGIFYYHDKI